MLEKYFDKDIFSDKKLQDIGRPKMSLFVRRCYTNVVLVSCSFFLFFSGSHLFMFYLNRL